MSDYSVVNKCESLHSDITDEINDLLISFQDKSRTVQAKDAFWWAFEHSRSHPDDTNILAAWEDYKKLRNGIVEVET